MRHLISSLDFSVGELDKLMDLANDIEATPEKYAHACAGQDTGNFIFMNQVPVPVLSLEAAMYKSWR